jgi:trigger factor
MKINIEKTSEVERKLSIEVPWEKYSEEMDRQFSRIRKGATLKGFRKGKAPMEMVRRMYRDDAHNETVNTLATEAVKDVVDEHELKTFGNPYITDVKTQEEKALTLEAVLELEPVFELADYSNLVLEKPVPEATEEEIDNFLERLRENRGQSVKTTEDRGLREDDIAVIDYSGFKGGEPVEELQTKDSLVRIGRSETIAGFEEQILGMKKEETREFDLTFPDDFSHEELAGQLIHFNVTLKEIRILQLPDLDDEFAKSFGKFETMDDLMSGIRDDILKTREEEATRELRGNLARRLVEDNAFDVPPSMVERELRYMVHEYGENLKHAGVSNNRIRDMILANEENLKKNAADQVRMLYIIGEIAEKEDIKATADEIKDAVTRRAQKAGRETEDLMKELAADGTLADIGFNIAREKVFARLLEKATIREVKTGSGNTGKEKKEKQTKKSKKQD